MFVCIRWIYELCPVNFQDIFSMTWITSIDLAKFLMTHPNVEYECRMRLGCGISSTHWWYFDLEHSCFQHSRDIQYSRVSLHEFLFYYKDSMWRVEQ